MVEVFIIAWVVAEMDEAVYKYDYETQDWILSEDEWFNNADIEDIPFVFELNCDPMAEYYNEAVLLKSAWDTAKRKYIPYSELKEYDYNRVGYFYLDVKNEYPFYNKNNYKNYKVRYRLKIDEKSELIHVFADDIEVKFIKMGKGYCPVIKDSIVEHWCINFREMKEYTYIPREKFYKWKNITTTSYLKNHISLPKIVINGILDSLKSILVMSFGYKPSTVGFDSSLKSLYAFMERPLDYRISLLHSFIGPSFKNKFSYDEPDNFSILCKYLKIKPTKGLKRAYTFKYSAIIMHKIAEYIGFKDNNAIRLFYDKDSILHIKTNEAHYIGNWFNEKLSGLKMYVQLCIEQKGEMWTAKRILSINSNMYIEDILRLCVQCKDFFDKDIIYALLNWNFDKELHDYLVEIVNERVDNSDDDYRIEYSPEELKLECVINGYEFALVHYTSEFYWIGKSLSNCVGGYKNDVKNGFCKIITISKNNQYVAAIELVDDIVYQALAKCNQPLSGDVRMVFGKWKEINKLAIKEEPWGCTHDWLDDINLEGQDFVIESRPYKKSLGEMSWKELVDLEADRIKPRYYQVLGKRLLEDKEFPKISAPSWKQFKNELEYLEYHFPEGYRIYEAAYEGVSEAQRVLSDMYIYGSHIPLNIKYGMYWLGLSRGYSIETIRYMVDENITPDEKSQLYMTMVSKISKVSKEYGVAAFQRYMDKIIVAKH